MLVSTNLLYGFCTYACLSVIVAVEEENEMDTTIPRANNFDKLSDLQKHQIKHRELFLSRQIETYKIDMVR